MRKGILKSLPRRRSEKENTEMHCGKTISRIPFWLKISFTSWVMLWIPFYWGYYGPQNFLWFCDIGNFAIALALWTESRLIFSWQAISLLLIQILYTIDLTGAFFFGIHPIGGCAAYMFNSSTPLVIRLLSLFHVATPPLLIWALWRLGYDRRALLFQVLTCWIILPLSFLCGPEKDINWVWGFFDKPQTHVSPWVWLALCMVSYPLFLYLPSDIALTVIVQRWKRKRRSV